MGGALVVTMDWGGSVDDWLTSVEDGTRTVAGVRDECVVLFPKVVLLFP